MNVCAALALALAALVTSDQVASPALALALAQRPGRPHALAPATSLRKLTCAQVTKGLPVYVTGARGSPRLSRVDGELIAILAISQRWLGSHISDPHFHMRTRGTHAYHAFPAARATRTPSPAYACGGCHQRVSS